MPPFGAKIRSDISLRAFSHFGRPFLEAFKCHSNSVGAQNIERLLKMFSSIHFNNLLGMKTKRASVNRKYFDQHYHGSFRNIFLFRL